MRGILLRVGIDQTFGEWNAPVDPDTREFVYLPIPEDLASFHPDLKVTYDTFTDDLASFARGRQLDAPLTLPPTLAGKGCHLDPDFKHLTYGDQPHGRGTKVTTLEPGDFIAFFASLKPVRKCEQNLLYSLIGIFFVERTARVRDIPESRWHINAHTRRSTSNPDDLVVFADRETSGRFSKCIPIGSYRQHAYRVRSDLLDAWGDLDIEDGFIQRSVNPQNFVTHSVF